ncbi:hypothetical protein LTS10_009628 [Elasticomyces elasticus]|nr:hypothetical protein LTS10_009628 [Elasticomyces elasticus]
MASDQDCHFLRIPLEMRREIYSHTTCKTVPLTAKYIYPYQPSDEGEDEHEDEDEYEAAEPEDDIDEDDISVRPMAGMLGLMISSILLVNRQIHDEYVDFVKARQRVFIDLGGEDVLATLEPLRLRQDTSTGLLKSVRHVHIFMKWSAVLHSAADERFSKFVVDHTNLELLDQESLSWTPAKVLRDKLRAFLGLISLLFCRDATVVIHIDLGDFPDPEDPFTWKPALGSEAGVVGTTVKSMVHAFHINTIRGLEHDTTLDWPTPGHLKIEGMIRMPLWCSMATNSNEVAEGLRAWRQGLSDQVILPQYKESAERVSVKLVPEVGKHILRGYKVLMSAPYALTDEEEELTWAS